MSSARQQRRGQKQSQPQLAPQQSLQGGSSSSVFESMPPSHPNMMFSASDMCASESGRARSVDTAPPFTGAKRTSQMLGSSEVVGDAEDACVKSSRTMRGGKQQEKSASTYASRHQAAESRRRQRINDRLDLLRKVVPHTDRANTAAFLEEVIAYVVGLQRALSDATGVPEAQLDVPQVDIEGFLSGSVPLPSQRPAPGPPQKQPAVPLSPSKAAPEANNNASTQAPILPLSAAQPASMAITSAPSSVAMPVATTAALSSAGQMPAIGLTDAVPISLPLLNTQLNTHLSEVTSAHDGMMSPAVIQTGGGQVLVPVAFMQNQGSVSSQAYMLVNREEYPSIISSMNTMGSHAVSGLPTFVAPSPFADGSKFEGLAPVNFGDKYHGAYTVGMKSFDE